MELLFIILGLYALSGLDSGGGSDGSADAEDKFDNIQYGTADGEMIGGSGGDDLIYGGDGADRIVAKAGDDTVFGGSGDDVILLRDGDDTYAPGEDINIDPFTGDDFVYGEGGNDIIVDFLGSNGLFGGDGDDFIISFDQPDTAPLTDEVRGGQGDDILGVDNGDTVQGGRGADVFAIGVDNTSVAPVTIVDFEQDVDLIELFVNDLIFSPQVTQDDISVVQNGDSTQVWLRDIELAVVQGATNLVAGDVFLQLFDGTS